MKKSLIFITALLMLVSCGVHPSKIGNSKKFVDKLTYVRDDRTGLCFAIVGVRKSRNITLNGLGIACVPCAQVKHLLEK